MSRDRTGEHRSGARLEEKTESKGESAKKNWEIGEESNPF